MASHCQNISGRLSAPQPPLVLPFALRAQVEGVPGARTWQRPAALDWDTPSPPTWGPRRRPPLGGGGRSAKDDGETLDERVRANRQAIEGGGRYLTWMWFAASGLSERTRKLYAATADVAAAPKTP